MSDTPEQEPSIEEILSSIRQIISDDDEADEAAEKSTPEPVPEPAPEPEAEEEDILDLTEVVGEIPEATLEPEPEPEIEIDLQDADESEPAVSQSQESILTDHAADATLQGFSSLLGNLAVDRGRHPGGITLEDIVRELMKPMLRDWLDQNLPPLIEKLVREELERLARKAMNK